jgi:hypothetical protein
MIIVWDVNVGPWFARNPSGNHNMLFLHRGRFRSNTVSNTNAFGPKKSFIKIAQNLDLPALHNTNKKMSYALSQQGTYHFRNIYDAGNKQVTLEMFQNGELLRSMQISGTAKNKVLLVDATGLSPKGALFAEFGHHAGQHPPEVPNPPGWRFSDLRIEMQTKNK